MPLGALALVAVAAGLAYRLVLARYCLPGGPSWELSDDMWYSLAIARHIASGHGATCDGLIPTNGFHPLYALLLTGLFRAGVSAAHMPVAALSLLAVADAATGLLLFFILRARGMALGGLVACLLWMFNVEAVAISHLGVETPLATLLLAASLYAYLGWRSGGRGSARGLAAAGVLVGLAALARTDSFLMAAAFGLDLFLLDREGRSRLRAALPLAVAVLVASPWFLWNLVEFGTVSQVSAKALIYRQQASLLFSARERLRAAGLGAAGTWLVLGLGWLAYSLVKVPNWFLRLSGMLQPSQLFWLAAGGSVLLRAREPAGGRAPWAGAHLWRPLVIFLALVGLAYGLAYHHAHRWYFESSIMACCLLAGLAAQDIRLRLGEARPWGRAAALATLAALGALLLMGAAVFMQLQQPFGELKPMAEPWAEVDAVVPEGSVVGSFNSGQLGYYSARRVVNLDGVVNNRAWEAIRAGRLWDYMRRAGIDYLADDPGYIKKFAPYGGPGYMAGAQAVPLPGGGTIWRLPWARSVGAGASSAEGPPVSRQPPR